jgi:stearoyl-CoA desaturase (delta-9 desaturase)
MGNASVAVVATPNVPLRDRFAYVQITFFALLHAATILAIWYTNWAAVGVAVLLHALTGGLGICVGFHRLLTHRSFKCPRVLEYTLATLGALAMEGPITEWVAHHRQHHQYSDEPGDPHSARQGFWWSHVGWMFWIPRDEALQELKRRYVPDLLRLPFYGFLDRMYVWLSLLLGLVLYLLGGWPFVVWGMFVRIVVTYHHTWLVNSASHAFGYKNFDIGDLSTNCWWVALCSYGEGWHNNHHAFPTSARHGLRSWEIDPSFGFISLLEAVGLAWDVRTPPPEKLKFEKSEAAPSLS